MVVVVQPNDCSGMAPVLEQLSSVLERAGMEVHGLLAVSRSDTDLADSVLASGLVPFRLERVKATDLATALRPLGFTATPVVVLADGQGRVRYLAPLDPSVIGEEASRIIALSQELTTEAPLN